MDSENLNENNLSVANAFADCGAGAETTISDLVALAERIERLVQRMTQLEQENRALREQNHELQTERTTLRDKGEQLRARIDTMVVRLRDMEQGS